VKRKPKRIFRHGEPAVIDYTPIYPRSDGDFLDIGQFQLVVEEAAIKQARPRIERDAFSAGIHQAKKNSTAGARKKKMSKAERDKKLIRDTVAEIRASNKKNTPTHARELAAERLEFSLSKVLRAFKKTSK
jgi:hypothetical protein